MKYFKNIGGFVAMIAIAALFLTPALALAQATEVGSSDPTKQDTTKTPDKKNFQLVSCDGVQKFLKDANGNYTNQLDPNSVECDYNQLIKTFQRVINFVLWIITPIVVGMMVYSGFKYMTAGGDANLIADAKRMFIPIATGIFFIMAGWLLVYTVLDKLLDTNAGGVPKSSILPGRVGPTN
ncbi:MAG: Type secretion system pilin [Candidatus Parcubacteria bacterium]|jgi:hypothetical protein